MISSNVGSINVFIEPVLKLLNILGVEPNQSTIVIVFIIFIILIALCIHQIPKLMISWSLIRNNQLREKERILNSKWVAESTQYFIYERLQIDYVKKSVGIRANSLFMVKKCEDLLVRSQGEISQNSIKKAQAYLVIKDGELVVNLTKFDIVSKYIGGFLWWLLVLLGMLAVSVFFIFISLMNAIQLIDIREVTKPFYILGMGVGFFMGGLVFLNIYSGVVAAEKIRDFIKNNPV